MYRLIMPSFTPPGPAPAPPGPGALRCGRSKGSQQKDAWDAWLKGACGDSVRPMRTTARPDPQSPVMMSFIRAIIRDDAAEVAKLLGANRSLASEPLGVGATRQAAAEFFFEEINHYLFSGDTPLHAAAAGYRVGIAQTLIQHGAKVTAANRRGAQPLHYAADGGPGVAGWDPLAQARMITLLIESGAAPDPLDNSGVAPLHRAVRQRSSQAVQALLYNGANVRLRNKSGSTPLHLAVQNTGRAGTGSDEARNCQREIIALLLEAGASPEDRDGRDKTAAQAAQGEWIQALL